MLRAAALAWLGSVIVGLVGCQGLKTLKPLKPTASPLPVRNSMTFDQLVIHSDTPLSKQHRLLDDLRVQRSDLLSKLNLPGSDEPIHVYLFDTEESFERFLHEEHPGFPSRRAFFIETDKRLSVYAQWGDRVSEDLRHEVSHGYLHSVVPSIPLWLDEGLAEYFEVPRGQGGVNRPHVQMLSDKLMREGWRPNLERLESLERVQDMTQNEYAESWLWVHWMLESDPRLTSVVQQYLAQLRDRGASAPLSATIRVLYPQPEQAAAQHLGAMGTR